MARQNPGDLYPFQDMSDDEIRDLVLDHLTEVPLIEPESIDVNVSDGRVTLSGRVGTDAEVQVAASLVSDLLGIKSFQNDLVVDELRRSEAPFGADDAIAQDAESGDPFGDPDVQQSDTAEHLVEDLDAETFGTHDIGKAIRDANSYTPPDRPVSGGYGSREDH